MKGFEDRNGWRSTDVATKVQNAGNLYSNQSFSDTISNFSISTMFLFQISWSTIVDEKSRKRSFKKENQASSLKSEPSSESNWVKCWNKFWFHAQRCSLVFGINVSSSPFRVMREESDAIFEFNVSATIVWRLFWWISSLCWQLNDTNTSLPMRLNHKRPPSLIIGLTVNANLGKKTYIYWK